jgi:uncharacterized membrane protein
MAVRRVDENRWHFRMRGPAGVTFEWDGLVTDVFPGRYLAWASTEGAPVRNRGTATFEPMDRGTRVTIEMTYHPPLGLVGHELARLFGADPKRELIEDLVRLKSLLEEGKATGANGTVTREDLDVPPTTH